MMTKKEKQAEAQVVLDEIKKTATIEPFNSGFIVKGEIPSNLMHRFFSVDREILDLLSSV
jgi:hypothetical protein